MKGNRVRFVYVPCHTPHLLCQLEKGSLNAEFGGAGIIHHVCVLTLLNFHSLGPCPRFCFFFLFSLSSRAVLYSVHLQQFSEEKKQFRYDLVCAQFQLPILPPHFLVRGCKMLPGEETDFAATNCEP